MVSKRGTALSGIFNIIRLVGVEKASVGSARGVLAFAWCLFCVGHLLLSGYAASGDRTALGADRTRPLEKTQWSDAGKSKQIRRNHDRGIRYDRKIDLIYRPTKDEHLKTPLNRQTPTPQGWEPYDGSVYSSERGYGWLANLRGYGRDRGTLGIIILADGTKTSAEKLGRPELANFQGRHGENRPLVFRIDLPNGWYRVTCASVDPDRTQRKPLVDQRSFKCRSRDVVFAGANYGPPTVVGGRRLVEGSGIVEVTDGHLRVVVGDPSYPGWTWSHAGRWYSDLRHWRKVEFAYARDWWQRLTRIVDPGFHMLSLNSLKVERVREPAGRPAVVFRDFFNRNDSSDVNADVAPPHRWIPVKLHPRQDDSIRTELRHTAIVFNGGKTGVNIGGLLQQQISPAKGVVRYSTRVSLFTGEGSQKHSGTQEAGIVLLADPAQPQEFNSTFIGVQFDSSRTETKGRLVYRVGDGRADYRTNVEVPDTELPFKITEGEFEIVVDHDVASHELKRVEVNGFDVTDRWSIRDRTQPIARGLFGLRSLIHNTNPRVSLQQFYWHYRVEGLI